LLISKETNVINYFTIRNLAQKLYCPKYCATGEFGGINPLIWGCSDLFNFRHKGIYVDNYLLYNSKSLNYLDIKMIFTIIPGSPRQLNGELITRQHDNHKSNVYSQLISLVLKRHIVISGIKFTARPVGLFAFTINSQAIQIERCNSILN